MRGAVPEAERGGVERVGFSRGLVFPGEVVVPAERRGGEDKEEGTRHAVDEARKMSGDMDTIWTDGSRLENGRVGAGIAWFEKGEEDRGCEKGHQDGRAKAGRGSYVPWKMQVPSEGGGRLEKQWFWVGRRS